MQLPDVVNVHPVVFHRAVAWRSECIQRCSTCYFQSCQCFCTLLDFMV